MPTAPALPAGVPAAYGDWTSGVGQFVDGAGTIPVSAVNDPINLWQDQTGNGRHLTPGASVAPQYDPAPQYPGGLSGPVPNMNPLLGYGGTKFNGTTMGVSNAAAQPCPTTVSPVTWLIICLAGNDNLAVGLGADGGYMAAGARLNTGPVFGQYAPTGVVTAASPLVNAPRGFIVRYDPAQATVATKVVFHDGGAALPASTGAVAASQAVAAGLWLGKSAALASHAGTILRIVCWNSALSDANLAALDLWIGANYLRTGYTHLHVTGDSNTKGIPGNQQSVPALFGTNPGGQGDSWGLKLWHALYLNGGSFRNLSESGYTYGPGPLLFGSIASFLPAIKATVDPWAARDIVSVEGGINDLGVLQTDVQVIASAQSVCSPLMAAGFRTVILWTVAPDGAWSLAGQVEEPRVTAGGSGYATPPAVTITAGAGSGASATAVVAGGVVTRITLDVGGSGYSGPITVAITGGGGTGATATSKVSTGGTTGGIPAGNWTDQKEGYRQSYNAWVRASAVAGGYCHVVYDPEAMGFTNPAGPLWTSDQLHFSEAGNVQHASNLAGILAPGGVPTPPLPFGLLTGSAAIGLRRGGRP